MKYYSHSNNKVLIGHFPGETRYLAEEVLHDNILTKFNKPNNIDIVCVLTDDHKESSPLAQELRYNNYSYYNYCEDKEIVWVPQEKPKYVLESLKMCKNEYTLVLDGDDVVILNDLDDIITQFNTYNKKIIYNASIWMYPKKIIDRVPDRYQYGEYAWLNAGCCIGKTKDLIPFYEEVVETLVNDNYSVSSEQYYVRKVFDKHQDTVFFDYDCKIFQCWHKPIYEYKTVDSEERCYLM